MTQEDKPLLLKDLSARLPYGVKFQGEDSNVYTLDAANYFTLQVEDVVFKPYLRPMSSMTEEEKKEVSTLLNYEFYIDDDYALVAEDERHRVRLDLIQVYTDWLNAHHFDHRGLIPMGLALEAPEGMYKTE